ncbi:hypothetical protein HPELS_00545 [Helicobacter pylori ELS37]|uniref:Uncharacterized protein n=1 Tax=Helicobacter pylori ELS37 TaxID=1055527 RepID=A0ABC7ZE04_HELPX|nr:hypothetical protein HPELS_00545 [Helicobacter pylori ELS37]
MLAFRFFQRFSNNRILILLCTTHFSGGGVHLEAELSN